MKLKFSFPDYPIDVMVCMLWSIILLPIALLDVEGSIRIILGLPFILSIPGYILVFALFPEKKTDQGIDIIERIALSLGLSLAVVPLIGLGLNYTSWGIRLEPILFSLFIFIIGLGSVGIYRWFQTKEENRFIIKLNITIAEEENKLDKALTIILVASIIIAVSMLIYVIVTPKTGEKFTEFYILGPNGIADDYPNELLVGENASISIGIVNHEYKTMNYTIEIWLINQSLITNTSTNESETIIHHMWYMDTISTLLDHIPIDIESNWTAQWEQNYSFTIHRSGNHKLAFLLFNETSQQSYTKRADYVELADQKINNAYRSLHLWLNVKTWQD